MSKYWETGEKNKFGKECYKLHFTQFYDDEVVAGFVQDEEDDNMFIYTSKEMKISSAFNVHFYQLHAVSLHCCTVHLPIISDISVLFSRHTLYLSPKSRASYVN